MQHRGLPAWLAVLLIVSIAVLSGCSAGTGSIGTADPGRLSLTVLPESFVDGCSAQGFSLQTYQHGGLMIADVHVSGAQGLKALYFELSYDAQHSRLISAEPAGFFAVEPEVLRLAALDRHAPGRLWFGAVLAGFPGREGFSGDGVLATVRFRVGSSEVPIRAVSGVPSSSLSAAVLVMESGSLKWYCFNQGDYDQNGEVNLADLTPIAANFHATGFDFKMSVSCVDGDDNGEVNLGDIQPIAANFQNSLDGYHVYRSVNYSDYPATSTGPNGPGAFLINDVPFSSIPLVAGKRKSFSVAIAPPGPNDRFWVRPYDANGEGIASGMVQSAATWHTTVVATGSGGAFGLFPSLAMVNGRPAIAFKAEGNPGYVRASDDLGTTWGPYVRVMNDPEDNGDLMSLAVINGLPAVAFSEYDRTRITYVQAADTDGAAWGTPVEVELQYARDAISLAEVNHRPAVAYDMNSGSMFSVWYERAGDAAGTNWAVPSTAIDGGVADAKYASLAIVNGHPAVAFQRLSGNGELYYTYSTDINGGSWATPIQVYTDVAAAVGANAELLLVGGHPAIACYVDAGPTKRRPFYVRNADAEGTGPWDSPSPTPADIRDPVTSGLWISMAVVGSQPYMAFYDMGDMNLRCAPASDAIGSTWQASTVVDDGGGNDVGLYCSMADVNGHPAIAYQDLDALALKYAVVQ